MRLNRDFIRKEWGAVTFVGTVILGGLAVLVALIVKAASPTAIPATPPCPKSTPIVIQAQASPNASPTAKISIPTVPFGCPTVAVVVKTPTPSPSPTASSSASATATASG
ncbi:MAG: hypothetical protein WB801_06005 [Candidatus Dormiibacterota bacterium]